MSRSILFTSRRTRALGSAKSCTPATSRWKSSKFVRSPLRRSTWSSTARSKRECRLTLVAGTPQHSEDVEWLDALRKAPLVHPSGVAEELAVLLKVGVGHVGYGSMAVTPVD